MPKHKNPSDISKFNIERARSNDGADYDAILAQVDREVRDAEQVLDPWKNRIVKYYELYKMFQSKKHYEGLAQIFVPEILRAVETIVGNLYSAIVNNNPWFEYEGRTKDEDASAAAQTQLTMYQMDENGFKHRLMDSLRQMATAGLTVRKVMWDFQQVARTKRERVKDASTQVPTDVRSGPNGKPVSYTISSKGIFLDTVKDHWTFEPVDLLSLLIPDVSIPYNDMQKSPWIAEQYIVDKQWISQRTRKGWLVSVDPEEYQGEGNSTPTASSSRNLKDNRLRSSGFIVKSAKKDGVEIVERWGLLPAKYVYDSKQLEDQSLDPEDEIETVLIVANRRAILKLEANPFWHNQKPYLFCPYVPQENEFDGIGVSQIGEKLQEELNDTRNQLMDNKTLNLMCMWLKSRSSGIKNKDLKVKPLGIIPTNDMKGLEALRPPVLAGLGVNIESVIKNDLRESVGASSNAQGIAQAGVGSATEAAAINAAGAGRNRLTVELYGELVLKPMLIFAEYNNYQFYNHTKTIRIIGPQGIKLRKLTPEELVGNKDVILRISTDLGSDPATRRQQFMQYLTIVQKMQPQEIEFHWKLLDKIYKESFGGRGLDEIYNPPVEEAELLTTDEEVDLILSGYPLLPKNRPDAKQHAAELEQEYNKVRWSLGPQESEVFKSVILGYEQIALVELQKQQAQLMMQMAAQGQNGGNGGTPLGQMPGVTADTQPLPTNGAQNSGVA